MSRFVVLLFFILLFFIGCGTDERDGRPYFVATTMMLEDAISQIGGDLVQVYGLMGPGVDPHMYRATPRDFQRMEQADMVVYNGLFLEARLSEILSRMDDKTYAAAEILPEDRLIEAYEFGGNFDPHVWFDVSLWADVVRGLSEQIITKIPDQEEVLRANTATYLAELEELHNWVVEEIASIPENRRVLITAHDAFGYFGKAYNIEVKGLQGLSTQTEVGLQDVRNMVRFIMANEIPAIFLETSIAPRSIQSIINGVQERGGQVSLGGELFSDAMGERNTPEGTYIGMVRHNVNTITNALK